MAQLKLNEGCQRCGYNEHPAALDFNHIDPSTKFKDPSEMASYSTKRLQDEIDKCEVLCANCHRIHTAGMGQA